MAGIADADRVNAFATQAANDVRLLWLTVASGGVELSTLNFLNAYTAARDAP